MVDRAVLLMMEVGGVEASWIKSERAWADGTKAHRIDRDTWSPRLPGDMDVLGKLHSIKQRTWFDKPERIAEAKALLTLIEHDALTNKRQVREATIRRSAGILNFMFEQCAPSRAHLQSHFTSITAADAWQKKPTYNNRRTPGRTANVIMGKFAFDGAELMRSGTTASLASWKSLWQEADLGGSLYLDHRFEEDAKEVRFALDHYNEEAWMPLRSNPDDSTIFIMMDSAGKCAPGSTPTIKQTRRGAGAWLWCANWDHIRWIQFQWRADVLDVSHSTSLEGANAAYCIEYCDWAFPNQCLVPVLDSLAFTLLFRKGSSKKPACQLVLSHLISVMRNMTARVLPLWQDRARGQIADDISKFENALARAALAERYPSQPMRRLPERIPAHIKVLINNETYARTMLAAQATAGGTASAADIPAVVPGS